MQFRKILALLALAVLTSAGASAQLYNAASKIPWNKYVASRIPDGYVTIIGQPGTNQFAGSATAGGSATFKFPTPTNFPINFTFLGVTYPQGSTTPTVAASGYINFNGSTSGSSNPRLDYQGSGGAQTKLIMPYWSDVQPSGTPEGGVFWRVDGATGNRVLTVEWRVQGISAPTRNPGNFQAKLFEQSGKIEYFYGGNSIDRSTARGTQGALVGLKNFGYESRLHDAAESDAEKFLLILNPDLVRDTIALTRTRNMYYEWFPGFGGAYYPETYASWVFGGFDFGGPPPFAEAALGRASIFWHYSFPTLNGARIGYRITPVDNDVATDSVWLSPTRAGNAYALGSAITVNARFANIGINSRQNIPVQVDVYREGSNTLLASRTATAFTTTTAQFGTDVVTFSPPIGPPTTSQYGTYVAKIYTKMTSPTDQDPTNDTMTVVFYISYPHDVTAYSILQPVPYTPVFPQIYPVNYAVPVEGRFLNIGTNIESNVPVGYGIYDGTGTLIYSDNSGVVRGTWNPLEFRDVTFSGWTPTTPGDYYIRIWTLLDGDQQVSNDTFPRSGLGVKFTVRYEIEVQPQFPGAAPGISPRPSNLCSGSGEATDYPDGRPMSIIGAFVNHGFTDATSVPAIVQIRNAATLQLVYNRTSTIPNIPGDGSLTSHTFPDFIPNGAGTYNITVIATDPQDPVRGNDTVTWCFSVKPRLAGTIRVGLGERYRTVQEAADSLLHYGVGGPLTFELVDDIFVVRPTNNDPSNPAYDFRGDIIGSGPNNPIVWRPVAGKDSVTIVLKSPSGIGFWFGQGGPRRGDTSNPTGYMTFDGGASRKLHFRLDTAGLNNPNRAIPFLFSNGSSNYAIRGSVIYPDQSMVGKKTLVALSLPIYNQSFNTFTYQRDLQLQLSAGILLRNFSPTDVTGNNSPYAGTGRTRDTLRNRNNVFDNNVVTNFGYGYLSIGAGALYRVGNPVDRLYEEYNNGNNQYTNSVISDVTRAGVAVAYEDGSLISNNHISTVENNSTTIPHAAGIWATAGAYYGLDSAKNRAYSTNLKIERNMVHDVTAGTGNAAGIWLETAENVFTSTTRVFRFPVGGATNNTAWNNMVWNYTGQAAISGTGVSAGIGLTIAQNQRADLLTIGNKVENNTIYNQIAGNAAEYGVVTVRNAASIRNNIIALASASSTMPTALAIAVPNYKQNVVSDYNLFQVDSGYIGLLSNLSVSGLNIPSPPRARTLNQWRALTGLDEHSVSGRVTDEFVSTTPGRVDLHIRPNTLGSLANNRGIPIAGLNNDIDGDPRQAAGQVGRIDIGADEFNGLVRNNDVVAEDVLNPFGYAPMTGAFYNPAIGPVEYIMTDSMVPLVGRFRNMGGLPQTNTVTLRVERYNGTTWSTVGTPITRTNQTFNLAQIRDVDFGTFMPQTLAEAGVTDAMFGAMRFNVTPIYRFTITSGTDDFAGNNTYTKLARFYVQRSSKEALVSVENYMGPTATPIQLSNKLNADTLVAALDSIRWQRADGAGTEEYDLFDRSMWPSENLNFQPWQSVIWAQGEEPEGLLPQERSALKLMLENGTQWARKNLIIAGQEVARIHDVLLTAGNGMVSDQDFVNNYLRAQYVGPTAPPNYAGRHIRGIAITPGKYERIDVTGVPSDLPPMPSLVRTTSGQGIARATHNYTEQTIIRPDSAAGVATAAPMRNVIFYAIDWRHYGRFAFEPERSGAQRLLLAAIEFIDQYQGVVPVKLLSFDAFQSGRGQKSVTVEFTTTEEVDVAGLEIERAVVERGEQGERVGEFTLVERRQPLGSATAGANYRVFDRDVEYGVEYRYRLVTVGLDGQRSVDASRAVKVLGATEALSYGLTVAPNPTSTTTTITLRAPEEISVSVSLYDNAGRLVKALVSDEKAGTIDLDVTDLASGLYTVRMQTATGVTLIEQLTVRK